MFIFFLQMIYFSDVICYYDEIWFDYKVVWFNEDNQVVYFGFYDCNYWIYEQVLLNIN